MNGNSKIGTDVEFVVQMHIFFLLLFASVSKQIRGVRSADGHFFPVCRCVKIGHDVEFDLQMHILFFFFCLQVCGQKWADISEYGAGLSVLTDSKYGYSSVGGILRISL